MKTRRIISLFVAAALLLLSCCVAEGNQEDLTARIAELEQQLAEAQALAEKYYPYYERQIVAEYNGKPLFIDDVIGQYEYYENMYAQSGITLTGSSYEQQVRMDVLQTSVENHLILDKAEELQIELTEDDLQNANAKVEEMIAYYVSSLGQYFAKEDSTDEDIRAAVLDYLAENGYPEELMQEDARKNVMLEAVYRWIIHDVEVTEDDIKAAYDEKLVADKDAYSSSSYRYEGALNRRETITWNPEGYRRVKQVLIGFDDDQTMRFNTLKTRISALNAEQPTEGENARTAEAIATDLALANAELEALYEELMPRVMEVVDRFANGEDFDILMQEYTADTAMLREPLKTTGYYVHKDYAPWIEAGLTNVSVWDEAFRDAAGAIANIGEISEPARGMYGIYIVYYMGDVPAGAVPIDDVRDELKDSVYGDKVNTVYADTIAKWAEEANVVYYPERFH